MFGFRHLSAAKVSDVNTDVSAPAYALRSRLSCSVGGVPTSSINTNAHRAQAGSRAAEPPRVSAGTLDAAEHGDSIPCRWRDTKSLTSHSVEPLNAVLESDRQSDGKYRRDSREHGVVGCRGR
jgi:hypothetical protein